MALCVLQGTMRDAMRDVMSGKWSDRKEVMVYVQLGTILWDYFRQSHDILLAGTLISRLLQALLSTHCNWVLHHLNKMLSHFFLTALSLNCKLPNVNVRKHFWNEEHWKCTFQIKTLCSWLTYRQLLLDCGIGVSSSSPGSSDLSSDPVVSQHRVLLFCQLKSVLDIVENDLLK